MNNLNYSTEIQDNTDVPIDSHRVEEIESTISVGAIDCTGIVDENE